MDIEKQMEGIAGFIAEAKGMFEAGDPGLISESDSSFSPGDEYSANEQLLTHSYATPTSPLRSANSPSPSLSASWPEPSADESVTGTARRSRRSPRRPTGYTPTSRLSRTRWRLHSKP